MIHAEWILKFNDKTQDALAPQISADSNELRQFHLQYKNRRRFDWMEGYYLLL